MTTITNGQTKAVNTMSVAYTTAGAVQAIKAKFAKTRAEMASSMIERDVEIDIVLTGLLSGHHPLLVGEPGTAKSLVSRTIAQWLSGEQFEILLNKFTDPMEVFGPISVEALKRDEYRRITDGTLVEAEIAFLDEIFKASTAILNSTLGVLNERRYRNGKVIVTCPLLMAVAASNEWPQDSDQGGRELGALFDRFLLRRTVLPIRSPEGMERLLWASSLEPNLTTTITAAEIETARQAVATMTVTPEAMEAFSDILHRLNQEGIFPGDRRKRWSVAAVKAFAFLNGADVVQRDHLEILSHTLWTDPREQPVKTEMIVAKVANPLGMEIATYLAESREIVAGIDRSDFESLIAGVKKLKNTAGKIKKLGMETPRVAEAYKYTFGLAKKMSAAAIEGNLVNESADSDSEG